MKRLPIGIQTFSKLRDPEEDLVYIDKTREILELVTGGQYFFLSRPRRFGKSVLVSTLYELFRGNRELFRGLYIEDRWDWGKSHPVIRISFGGGDFSSERRFDEALHDILKDNVERLQVGCEAILERPNSCFRQLIKGAHGRFGQKVVILIVVYAHLASLGFRLVPEDTTNRDRVDLTILLADRVYMVEFKVDGEGRALERIKERRYHEKYMAAGRKIYLVGMEFDPKERNIGDLQWEAVGP